MRLFEFVSAEDALKLWKVISDNTWEAIAQQAEAEARAQAERAAVRKSSSKRGVGKSKTKPAPPKRLPPPLQHVTAPVAKDAKDAKVAKPKTSTAQAKAQVGKELTQQMDGGIKQPQPNTAKPQQPNALPTQQKAVGMAQQQLNATNPQAAHLQQPHPTQQPLTPQQMRLQRQNVGYLAKNSAVTKRM